MTVDSLFASEPFEQFPGQLALAELDRPAYWRVTYVGGTEIVWARSAAGAADRVDQYVLAAGQREVLAVECLPFGEES